MNEEIALDPIWRRGDWHWVQASARMRVSICGGPIHDPHEPVLILIVSPWNGNDESWALYRHKSDSKLDGKIAHKKWDTERDLERFRVLGEKQMPEGQRTEMGVTKAYYPFPAIDVCRIQKVITEMKIPLLPAYSKERVTGPFTKYTFALKNGWETAEFEWYISPTEGWEELGKAFDSLWAEFRAVGVAASTRDSRAD